MALMRMLDEICCCADSSKGSTPVVEQCMQSGVADNVFMGSARASHASRAIDLVDMLESTVADDEIEEAFAENTLASEVEKHLARNDGNYRRGSALILTHASFVVRGKLTLTHTALLARSSSQNEHLGHTTSRRTEHIRRADDYIADAG
eukprot:6205254-Pleurochrysis_carterae.AAC.1